MSQENIIIQAHRGFHNLEVPENSLLSCLNAIKLGASKIEIDVLVTSDLQLIVTHDPKILGRKNTHPNGTEITKKDENILRIYTLTYDKASTFPFKIKNKESRFNKLILLKDLVDEMNDYAKKNSLKLPVLNIELKSDQKAVKHLYPKSGEYSEALKKAIDSFPSNFEFMIQSFDLKLLRKVSKFIDYSRLTFLVYNPKKEKDFIKECKRLGIIRLGINYRNLKIKKAKKLIEKGYVLSIWTINDFSQIERYIELGILDFITDKPDELIMKIKELDYKIQ